ncbi:MAG TPA: SRPBCC family protein [Pseudonocardia sp.]|nr:SRPBCC family protein [Pseudonocardia sp.]
MTAVLMVVSAATHWTLADGTKHPTGFWAEEFVEPHRIFSAAGWDITIATPGGVAPTVDQVSLGLMGGLPAKTRSQAAYLDDHAELLKHPKAITEVDPGDYDVVFYPGGHGPMEDLAEDAASGQLLTATLRSGTLLALLCHAPAAAFAASNPDGSWPFAGYRMTGLSNREESLNRFSRKAKWLLEDRLVQQGARYVKGPVPLGPFVTSDRNLYTGQNPASSGALARRLVAEIGEPALRISASRVVAAPPEAVYAVVSDVTTIGERSPETSGATWLRRGKRFLGHNNIGPLYRWSTVCTITEANPGKKFEFYVAFPSMSTWSYELTPVEGGTLVTETITKERPQYAPVRLMQSLVGVHDRGTHLRQGIETTLEAVASAVEPAHRV